MLPAPKSCRLQVHNQTVEVLIVRSVPTRYSLSLESNRVCVSTHVDTISGLVLIFWKPFKGLLEPFRVEEGPGFYGLNELLNVTW